ncbi:MAG: DUF3060 domain-containing protein [Armatimonadetes bacterium]|nr:DUF3060 domain-containing protein [Armatimonadota bacterium]
MRKLYAVVFLIILVVAPGLAKSLKDEVSWIDTLPGLSSAARRESATKCEYFYTVVGNASATYQSLRSNLTSRGWTLQNSADVGTGSSTVRAIIATRPGMQFKASVQDAGTTATLAVVVQTTGASSTEGNVGGNTQRGESVSGTIIVDENNETHTYQCQNNNVVVNGNNNFITLLGTCSDVVINGNNCNIRANARFSSLVVNGNNNNVRWSASKNPNATVDNNGNGNAVTRM